VAVSSSCFGISGSAIGFCIPKRLCEQNVFPRGASRTVLQGRLVSDFTAEGNTVTFWLRVKPRARRRRLLRNSSGELCLELTAPPVEGKANEAALDFLAESLHVPRRSVGLVTGAKSRHKLFRITSASAQQTIERLEALVHGKGG
jgi:uncharacterized protein